jgi:hypothetical protein
MKTGEPNHREKLITNPSKSLEEKKVAAQEILKCHIYGFSEQAKVTVLLAAQGEKPVSEFSFLFDAPKDQAQLTRIKTILTNDAKELGRLMENIGLQKNFEIRQTPGRLLVNWVVSKNLKLLQQLREVKKPEDKRPDESQTEYLDRLYRHEFNIQHGRLFGFPETAVQAYVNRTTTMPFEKLPENIKNSRVGRFIERVHIFGFSEAHWQDEFKVIEGWVKALDEIVPGYVDNIPDDQE